MDAGLSEWRMRQCAANAGYPVTHEQFRHYVSAGLLSPAEAEHGRWSEADAARLIRVRQLSDSVRSVPRRVIRLRGEPGFHDIPSDAVREAMIAIIPTVRTPMRKLKRVDAARRALAAGEFGDRRHTRHGAVPMHAEWAALLRESDPELFTNWLQARYHFAAVMRDMEKVTGEEISDIPLEEVVMMQMILVLADRKQALYTPRYSQ